MKNKYVFVAIMLCCILLISGVFTGIYVNQSQTGDSEDDFVVVTSFYPMYIATLNVVKDVPGVSLKNLSEPQTGCLHDFQLTPQDMKLLSTADVFIVNGVGIESFMEQIAAAYPELVIIEATEGMKLLGDAHEEDDGDVSAALDAEDTEEAEDADDADDADEADEAEDADEGHEHDPVEGINAHAWMSISNYRRQVENIADSLMKANPANTVEYERNAAEYDSKLTALQEEQQELTEILKGQSTIMFHCGFDYVAEDYGLHVAYCMDLDEERQVSAGEVAQVLSVIREEGVSYIFAEELYGKAMCETIQKEADVTIIYLDPLNRGEYEADSYIEAMSQNIRLLKEAFSK